MARKYVTFSAHGEEFGIPIDNVEYIEIPGTITQIPKSPKSVKGVSTIRGSVVPLLDVNEHLFNESIELEGNEENSVRIIGLKVNDHDIGLMVEEAKEVLDIDESMIQQIEQGSQQYTIAKLEDRLILLTEPNELMSNEEMEQVLTEVKQNTD